VEPLILADGTRLEVKPLEPADKAVLREGVAHLSPNSAYRRFLVATPHLSEGQLSYLTTLDHRRHEALGVSQPSTEEGVAVARYVRSDDEPATAEIAITVVDRWQGRGVGRLLLERLVAVARARGIVRFSGLILADNTRMIKLMSSLGRVVSRSAQGGTVELIVELDGTPLPAGHGAGPTGRSLSRG
jgi:GNAT superfamily N-acetyltransferase